MGRCFSHLCLMLLYLAFTQAPEMSGLGDAMTSVPWGSRGYSDCSLCWGSSCILGDRDRTLPEVPPSRGGSHPLGDFTSPRWGGPGSCFLAWGWALGSFLSQWGTLGPFPKGQRAELWCWCSVQGSTSDWWASRQVEVSGAGVSCMHHVPSWRVMALTPSPKQVPPSQSVTWGQREVALPLGSGEGGR